MATNTLENVKTVLDLKDNMQDGVLTIFISNAESRLLIWLKKHAELTEIPSELNFITEELVVNRYNRIGSEGAKSESVEGRSITFTDDDFKPYLDILETYTPKEERAGKVMFF